MSRSETAEPQLESTLVAAGFLQLTKCALIIERRLAAEARRRFNLGAREIWILLAAACGKPATQKQIAKYLVLNENVLVLMLDRLEKSGHVRRVRNPANRREQFLRLTPKGTAVTRRVLAAREAIYRAVFAPLDDAFIQTLLKASQRLLSFEATRSKATRR